MPTARTFVKRSGDLNSFSFQNNGMEDIKIHRIIFVIFMHTNEKWPVCNEQVSSSAVTAERSAMVPAHSHSPSSSRAHICLRFLCDEYIFIFELLRPEEMQESIQYSNLCDGQYDAHFKR